MLHLIIRNVLAFLINNVLFFKEGNKFLNFELTGVIETYRSEFKCLKLSLAIQRTGRHSNFVESFSLSFSVTFLSKGSYCHNRNQKQLKAIWLFGEYACRLYFSFKSDTF